MPDKEIQEEHSKFVDKYNNRLEIGDMVWLDAIKAAELGIGRCLIQERKDYKFNRIRVVSMKIIDMTYTGIYKITLNTKGIVYYTVPFNYTKIVESSDGEFSFLCKVRDFKEIGW